MKLQCTLAAVLVSVVVAVLSGGCAGLSALPVGSVIGNPNASALEIHNNTDVQLRGDNFIVIKTNVAGQSSGFSLLGIITIVPAKFTKAMSRLYAQAEMQTGRPQALVNLILEKDAVYYILFSIPRTSIRGDVIEFIPAASTNMARRLAPERPGFKTER
jgi:hypothetical protein